MTDKEKIKDKIRRMLLGDKKHWTSKFTWRSRKYDALETLLAHVSEMEPEEVSEGIEEKIIDVKDEAMRDMAWQVHVMISEGKTIAEIDHYVCGIVDF